MEEKAIKKYNRGGRKKKPDPAVFRYSIRLNAIDNAKFIALFLESGAKSKTGFIKSMIFNRTMKVVKIDKAAFDYYVRLTHFYAQFQSIGSNYNQIIKILNTNFSEKRARSLLYQLERRTIEFVIVMKKIEELTKEFEEKHLTH